MHPMSLADCIQEALQHNLDVQISRYNPQIQLFNLRGSYGGYDPTFNVTGQHQRNNQGAEFQNGLPVPASTSDQNTFNSDLGGLLPWGMKYDFNGNVQNNKNINFSVTANNISGFTNNSLQSANGSASLTLTQPLLEELLD